ncbi:hypothetical protein MSG28_004213 [Choristoneura fumiferana]|uniref:Uncharacterized protein n=1 Tax=Choristoneura fumiferana TaxID=7141 RepID=A0ACC0KJ83_CHOFU|nr:hypothetical protein MSG28_004213 [Choristoneura fumiferana]
MHRPISATHKVKQPRKGKSEQYKTRHINAGCIPQTAEHRRTVLAKCAPIMTTALFTLSCAALVAAAYCGRLEQTYLPPRPSFGGSHGGSSSFGSSSSSSSSFGASSGSFGGSSGSYGGSSGGAQIPIIKYDNVNNGDGSYHFKQV